MLTRDDVPELACFLAAYADLTIEEAIEDLMRYDTSPKAKRKYLLAWYEGTVKEREALISQAKLLLEQPIFPWKLACSVIWEEDPDEYYKAMGFKSEDEAIAEARGVLLQLLQKLEETPVPKVVPR